VLVCCSFIVHEVNDVPTMYGTNDALIDAFFDEEFPGAQYKKNFFEVMTPGEAWQWAQGPMLNALWPTKTYSGANTSAVLQHYVLSTFRRVGPVRTRQVRVGPDSCSIRRRKDLCVNRRNPFMGDQMECMGRFDTLDNTCWAEITQLTQYTEPVQRASRTYTYQELNDPLYGLYGIGERFYSTGGYVVDLWPDHGNASATIDSMVSDEWFDRGTRALSIDWNLYDTETRMATIVRVVFEFDEAAFMIPWFRINTFRVVAYDGVVNMIRLAAEVLFLLLWLRELTMLVVAGWRNGIWWFLSIARAFDVVLILAQFLYIYNWLSFLLDPRISAFDVNATTFQSYYSLGETFTEAVTWAGVVGLLMCLKLFLFLGLSKRMLTVWVTIQRALPDMLAFAIGFLVLVSGFACLGYFIFGFVLQDFHNIVSAIASLLRMALGDFDYRVLADARPTLAPLFFAVFIIVVFLLALTVFIGILTRYYERIHEELKVVDRWKETTPSYESELGDRLGAYQTLMYLRCVRCNCRQAEVADSDERVVDMADAMMMAGNSAAADAHRKKIQQTLDDQLLRDAQRKLRQLAQQRRFFSAADSCSRIAQENNNIDLQAYFEKMYELEPNSDRLYLTRDAIALIISKREAEASSRTVPVHGVHLRKRDVEAATTFTEAFHVVKDMQLFGVALEVETPELRALTMTLPFSHVTRTAALSNPMHKAGAVSSLSDAEKDVVAARTAMVSVISDTGRVIERKLLIDPGPRGMWAEFRDQSLKQGGVHLDPNTSKVLSIGSLTPTPPVLAAADPTSEAVLIILDLQSRPVRSLPLSSLILIENFREDARLTDLVFGSKDMSVGEERARGGLNVTIRVRFHSFEARQVFISELLRCSTLATLAAEAEDSDDDDDIDAEMEERRLSLQSKTDSPALAGKSRRMSKMSQAVAGLGKRLRSFQTPVGSGILPMVHSSRDDDDDEGEEEEEEEDVQEMPDEVAPGSPSGEAGAMHPSQLSLAAEVARATPSPRTRVKMNPIVQLSKSLVRPRKNT
jgi:hypothetical protein